MATLIPRKFKIQQDVNEYHYFVEYLNCDGEYNWYIHLGGLDKTMTNKHNFDYLGHHSLSFPTPDDALMYFNKYINGWKRDRDSSLDDVVVRVFQTLTQEQKTKLMDLK